MANYTNNATVKNKLFRCTMVTISSMIVLSVAFYAFFSMTSAWFTRRDDVDARNGELRVNFDDDVTVTGLYTYRYDEIEQKVMVYKEEPADQPNPDHLALNQFDTVFVDRQENTPIILKIPLQYAAGIDYKITITCKNLPFLDETDGKSMTNNLSNIIQFCCGQNTDLDDASKNNEKATQDEIDAFYAAAKTFFKDSSKKCSSTESVVNKKYQLRTFVDYTVSGSNITMNKNLSITFTIKGSSFYSSSGILTLYIYINYDQTLVSKYLSDSISATTVGVKEFQSGNVIEFNTDIDIIDFRNKAHDDAGNVIR